MQNHGLVVVVGGSGGIGSAVVRVYTEIGCPVLIVDKSIPQHAPSSVIFHQADITQYDELPRITRTIEKAGGLSHLICLAGAAKEGEWGRIDSVPDRSVLSSIELNLTSQLMLIKYLVAPATQEQNVVFISSINAFGGFGLTAYSAAKAGLLGAARELAASLAPRVRVNVVVPGTVPTPKTRSEPNDFDALQRATLLGRFATPEDIAEGCVFLTHRCTSITGQELIIDAGQTIRRHR